MPGFSLNAEMIKTIFKHAKPFGHHERPEENNLGFGFIYYGIGRIIRPDHILVIGSGFGFSVVCLALALKDNGKGKVTFVDPSFSVFKDGPFKTVGGRGTWDNEEKVNERFRLFGIEGIVEHYKVTSEEFFPQFKYLGLPKIDIGFIDGNHSYENVRYDFLETLHYTKKNSYLFLHDTNIYLRELLRNAGVKRWLKSIKEEKECFELIDFPFSSGVAMVRVLQDEVWKCLK